MKLATKTTMLCAALAIGGTAFAQTAVEGTKAHPMPLCSKTVKDECVNPSQAPHAMKAKARHHHKARAGHRHAAKKAGAAKEERSEMRK